MKVPINYFNPVKNLNYSMVDIRVKINFKVVDSITNKMLDELIDKICLKISNDTMIILNIML